MQDAQAEANYSAACRQTPDNDLQRPAEHTAPVVDVIDGHFDAATLVLTDVALAPETVSTETTRPIL